MIVIDSYKKLKNISIKNRTPKSFFPTPTEDDYKRGFIKRYFTQQRDTNGAPIIEISNDTFYDYSNTEYWNGIQLNWKITGNLDDRYNDDGGYIPSVQSVNMLAITEAANKLPDIRLYLVNLTQFHR